MPLAASDPVVQNMGAEQLDKLMAKTKGHGARRESHGVHGSGPTPG